MNWRSAIYEGWVRHRRSLPMQHEFRYRVFMMYLDLDELPALFSNRWFWSADHWAPAWFRRADHFGDPGVPLDVAVRDVVEARTQRRPTGRIGLLTHLRYWGIVFNPVSVFYCFEKDSDAVESLVLEVNNTPWGERHLYVIEPAAGLGTNRYRTVKAFHVSPYLGMDIDYDFVIPPPRDRLLIHMDCLHGSQTQLDATLHLKRVEITGAALANTLARRPVMTLRALGAIYWQALRLWWKGCPVYPHPKQLIRESHA